MTPKDAFFAGWTAHENAVATGTSLTAAAIWGAICARQPPKPVKSSLSGWGAFAAALKRVMSAAEKRSIAPILECVLLESSGGKLTLTCTDMDVALTETIDAPSLPDMRVTVPAKLLFNVAKNLPPSGDIAYEAPAEKDGGFMKLGGATLAARDPDDFPRVTPGAFEQTFTMPAATLLGALNSVKLGISTEETRYYLNGVHFCIRDDKLLFVSTDGHRLFCKSLPCPDGLTDINLILPGPTVGLLLPLLARRMDDVTIDVSDKRMRFSVGAVQLTTKLVDGTFPAFERVIPRENSLKAVFDARQLGAAVKAVAVVSKGISQPIKIDFGPDYARVLALDPESGTSVRDVYPREMCRFTALIGFHARYMLDTLSCIDGDAQIFFCEGVKTPGVCDAGAPVLVTMPEDDSWLSVIMPMRL